MEKDLDPVYKRYNEQLVKKAVLLMVIIIFILLVITYVIRRYNNIIMELAATDELTKLPNRKSFNTIFLDLQNKDDYSLFIFDIDCFKSINDGEGYLFGDEVLRTVAKVAQEKIAHKGYVARWGGDEFIGVARLTVHEMEQIFEQMTQAVQTIDLKYKKITLSMGVTKLNKQLSLNDAIEQADLALYEAKENGRNQMVIYCRAKDSTK